MVTTPRGSSASNARLALSAPQETPGPDEGVQKNRDRVSLGARRDGLHDAPGRSVERLWRQHRPLRPGGRRPRRGSVRLHTDVPRLEPGAVRLGERALYLSLDFAIRQGRRAVLRVLGPGRRQDNRQTQALVLQRSGESIQVEVPLSYADGGLGMKPVPACCLERRKPLLQLRRVVAPRRLAQLERHGNRLRLSVHGAGHAENPGGLGRAPIASEGRRQADQDRAGASRVGCEVERFAEAVVGMQAVPGPDDERWGERELGQPAPGLGLGGHLEVDVGEDRAERGAVLQCPAGRILPRRDPEVHVLAGHALSEEVEKAFRCVEWGEQPRLAREGAQLYQPASASEERIKESGDALSRLGPGGRPRSHRPAAPLARPRSAARPRWPN